MLSLNRLSIIGCKLEKYFFFFCTFFFVILYFFDFDDGVSYAPLWLRGLKEIVFLFISLFFVLTRKPAFDSIYVFFVYVFFVSCIPVLWGSFGFLKEGKSLILYSFVLLYWFQSCKNIFEYNKTLFIFSQFGLSLLLSFLGFTLWPDRSFAGTLGNPNVFGLMANVVFFMTFHTFTEKKDYFLLLICALSVLFSISLSQQLIFVFLLISSIAYYTWTRNFYRGMAGLCLLALFVISGGYFSKINFYLISGLYLKLKSFMIPGFVPPPDAISASITGRVSSFAQFESLWANGDLTSIVFGFFTKDYFLSDAFYLHILVNYGVLGLLLFIIPLAKMHIRQLSEAFSDLNPEPFFVMAVFSLSLLFTRFLFYFPVCIYFYLFYLNYRREGRL